MKPVRIRTDAAARRYVTAGVAATLQNDLDSGGHWLVASASDGNLDGPKSELLVQKAARELIKQLYAFSKNPGSQVRVPIADAYIRAKRPKARKR